MDKPFCRTHSTTPASGTCVHCLREVCDICTVFVAMSAYCASCARSRRRARSIVTASLLALVATGIAVGGVFAMRYVRRRAAEIAANPVVELSPEAAQLDEALRREPCDRRKIVELANLIRRAGESREVVRRADAFFARCGDFSDLRWIKADSLDDLSQWDAALAERTRLIESDPSSASFWFWRGVTYEHRGDLERAVHDYQQALALSPRINNVPFNLASVSERLHRPCDGIFPLEQFLYYNPGVRNALDIQARIARLYANDACRTMAGNGRALLHFPRNGDVVRAPVRIDGHAAGSFAIDTGASLVALSAAAATRLGIPFATWQTVTAQTAAGPHQARIGWVNEVEVQGVRARHVQVAVVDDLGDLDGLLGLSFLARFTVSIDHEAGTVEIAAH